MLTRIYHKKNEQFQTELYRDEQCQQAFDYEENVYIKLKDGDITPLVNICNFDITQPLRDMITIYTPYLDTSFIGGILGEYCFITTIDDITINLSKYIPEDNAVLFLSKVLFLSEEEVDRHSYDCEAWFLYQKDFPVRLSNSEMDIRNWKTITIFLTHGTESELKKANEIAGELKKRYGIEKVNLFALHWFKEITEFYEKILFYSDSCLSRNLEDWHILGNINKIIATNSTGILEPQNEKRLQILDCYDIFNDYLKEK